MSGDPLPERAGAGAVNGRVAEAVHEIQERPNHDSVTGRFLPGNTAAGNGTLSRSDALWKALEPAKRELTNRVRQDLALDGEAAATLEGLADAFAEATLLRRSLFVRLAELGGPVTSKGSTRALFTTYLQTLDRELRLATTLGLERRSKAVPSLAEVLAEGDV